ncbi:MAG: helix-turn-helix transcriptional regulator [Cyclobacteriaceae bacterium]|nr:helix-turn-helix transcriptional regulator [Cyclobacteriaceae bacterium]
MSDIIKAAFANIDPDNEQFIKKNTQIVEEIYDLMESKGLTQKDIAKSLSKSESEVSKWLSGIQNLTLRSITKMEVALGVDIIMTCSQAKSKYEKVNYVHVNRDATPNSDKTYDAPEPLSLPYTQPTGHLKIA